MGQILSLKNISKTFPGVKALKGISLELSEGEVHCLCGENGAGKSTLIKILSGAYQPDEGGSIAIDGRRTSLTPRDANLRGIQTIYQEHVVFDNLSIVENIFTGAEICNGLLLDRREMRRQTEAVLRYLKSPLSPDQKMGDLSTGQQKTVEIAKGLVFKRRVIVLDEPTASFSASEIETLLEIIQAIKQTGLGILYISHHLDEVFRLADRVTVIRDGQKVSEYPIQGLTRDTLVKDMVGRDPSTFYEREWVNPGEVILEARSVNGNGVSDVSFELRRGEILGIAGMVGSGRSELMNVVFGAMPLHSGEIWIGGRPIRHANPKHAIKNKLCFITEDRQNTGLFLSQTIAQNICIANLVNVRSFVITPGSEKKVGDGYVAKLRIRTKDSKTRAINLSGGNQQKVVLAKWFNTEGEIYIFDEPTHGIDVGSKQEIYQIMVDLLKLGKAILMVSSDMPEVVSMSDRVLVMKAGGIVAELKREDITEENILSYSIGESRI